MHTLLMHKADLPESNIAINLDTIKEWDMLRCESKNRHQKDMCSRDIEDVLKI